MLKKIISLILQSFKDDEHDFTKGSISSAVFLLAVPMILELSMESVFALVDMYFVGRLGANAIVTVGLTESVITIVYSIAVGLSTGATAIIARRVGEKNPDAAAHAGAQAIIISLLSTVLISVAGMMYAEKILGLMGATEAVIQEGAGFTRVVFGSTLFIMLLFLINGIFRGAGNAAMAMKSLWISSIVNIVLCPLFIHFWGLTGAAWATVVGRCTGVLYQCYHLIRGNGTIKFKARHFVIDKAVISQLYGISWPATLQFILGSGSWIILARLVAETGGTDASAGYQIAIRNVIFFLLPAWGLSNAAATLVGQNLGAKQIQRAHDSVMITARYNAIFMFFVMLLFLFCATPLVRFFSQESEVVRYGALALQIIGSAYVFYGVSMVMQQALNGAGDTKTPTIISLIGFWFMQIPLAWYLAKYTSLASTGAFVAIPVAETVMALMSGYYFWKGKWKTIEV